MKFIQKTSTSRNPLTVYLDEDHESPPEYDDYAMNFSLLSVHGVNLASGRCSVQPDEQDKRSLYISGIYVEGNTNNPTRVSPNRYSGLGQIMIYSAIKYASELNIDSVTLVPLDGSIGFYIKMGFYPKTNTPNLSLNNEHLAFSENKKINKRWLNHFQDATFLNSSFRQPRWYGNTKLIEQKLKSNILQTWDIMN